MSNTMTQPMTKEEFAAYAKENGFTAKDLKVRDEWDRLADLKSAHREQQEELKQEAIKQLPWATDEEIHKVQDAIIRGDSDAQSKINSKDGIRINEHQEGLIELAKIEREEKINTDEYKKDLGERIQNAHHISKAVFGRPNKTGKFAGKGKLTVSAYIG